MFLKYFFNLSVILVLISFGEAQLYKNAKLIRISNFLEISKDNLTSVLEKEYGCSVWSAKENSIDVVVKPDQFDFIKSFLNRNGILQYEMLFEDIQDEIDRERSSANIQTRASFGEDTMDWTRYHSAATISSFLNAMKTKYPNLVEIIEIGKSHEGRPLKVMRISENPEKNKKIWIDGGIHAREWISPAVATFIANVILSKWSTLPTHMTDKTWYIMPLVNPDGYEYSRNTDRFWRKNRRVNQGAPDKCQGVDLNRNFDADWANPNRQRVTDPCTEVYRGSKPFSEPETYAIARYLLINRLHFEAFLTFHSYGQYILYPNGYTRDVLEDAPRMDVVGTRAANKIESLTGSTYRVSQSNVLGLISGGSDDWAKKDLKLNYAYTIELRDKGNYGFILPESQISQTGAEGLIVVETIANAITEDQQSKKNNNDGAWSWSQK